MGGQLPPDARGVAAVVLIFSFVSEFAGLLLIWLIWTHREKTSYVAWIAYFTWIATTTSIIQQIHLYTRWEDVMTTQFHHTVATAPSAELIVSSSTTGMDLVLFYIRYSSFTIGATFVMFWGLFLALSMHGYNRMIVASNLGKVASIVFPVMFISLLQLDAVKRSWMGFFVLADLPLILSLIGGCVFVGAIIRKYVQTRRQIRRWSTEYRWNFEGSRIYDKWLLVRFSIGFFILALFNLTNIICQIAWQSNTSRDTLAGDTGSPDTSAARARHDSALFLPGVSSSLLAFVVFGTTAPFRRRMRRVFWDSWRAGVGHADVAANGNNNNNNNNNTPSASTKTATSEVSAPLPVMKHVSVSQTWTKSQAPAYEVTISGPLGGHRTVTFHDDRDSGSRDTGRIGVGDVGTVGDQEAVDIGMQGMMRHSGLRST